MSKKMYVGNLAWSVSSEDLQELFAAHGTVRAAEVIKDRETGRSRGFGFVEMETQQDMEAAIVNVVGQRIALVCRLGPGRAQRRHDACHTRQTPHAPLPGYNGDSSRARRQ